MTEKIMQPIFFVELCSQITSRVVFRSYKPICTFIWMPSKYTQMSLKPNHYLEPCHIRQFWHLWDNMTHSKAPYTTNRVC